MKSRVERGSQRTKYVVIDLNATKELQDWIQSDSVNRILKFAETAEKNLGLRTAGKDSSHRTNNDG